MYLMVDVSVGVTVIESKGNYYPKKGVEESVNRATMGRKIEDEMCGKNAER